MMESTDAIHITLELSNTIDENVHVAGDVIAYGIKGTPVAEPTEIVPPDRGEKYPFDKLLRLAIDAIPPVTAPVDEATNNPPSGDIAMPRFEPDTARFEGTSPFMRGAITCTPELDVVQTMEPLTLMAKRGSLPKVVNEFVVSTTPFALTIAIVNAFVTVIAPAATGML